jgi:hypothetical protein
MRPRTELQTLLETVIGSKQVYFQPPSSLQIKYPCIVYERSNANTIFADNYPYKSDKRYTITVIDKDPDSLIPDKVLKLQQCNYDRHFTADNLHHDVFNLYF